MRRARFLRLGIAVLSGPVAALLFTGLVWLFHSLALRSFARWPTPAEIALGGAAAPLLWWARLAGVHRSGVQFLVAPPEWTAADFRPREPVSWQTWLAKAALVLYLALLPLLGALAFARSYLPRPLSALVGAALAGTLAVLPFLVARWPHHVNRFLARVEVLGFILAGLLGGSATEAALLGLYASRQGKLGFVTLVVALNLAWFGLWIAATGFLQLWSERPWAAPSASRPRPP
ncbi:hypothetical protein OO015_13585 [Thermomicrobium sp. 4228-Ro]|uniref:hypothetical protein n=1 Tax=Thermomicrobium sp. 4228-Ro TaxID=2993937 RepID=UPI0022499F56|nr:hypothetical protein [Thermomicrobium sp. 4228-Ro]MCX2728517.1 hypothetical protein [Thermomicrobium sp. 4228-Ro]